MVKYISYDKIWGNYRIRRKINGKVVSFGTYKQLEDAEKVVQELEKCNWDKKELMRIKEDLGIPITRRINV
ncbi:MAG: hypothetical protein IJH63_00695 [Methanobrevibacter sp.]|nr:hypothetical protein [Methanosphaera sp.]MBR0369222.1 hypothetical protein [Methanobrevibacter sp.]